MPEWYRRLLDSFDACLITIVTEPMLLNAGAALDRLSPLLKGSGQIYIMVVNDRPYPQRARIQGHVRTNGT